MNRELRKAKATVASVRARKNAKYEKMAQEPRDAGYVVYKQIEEFNDNDLDSPTG